MSTKSEASQIEVSRAVLAGVMVVLGVLDSLLFGLHATIYVATAIVAVFFIRTVLRPNR